LRAHQLDEKQAQAPTRNGGDPAVDQEVCPDDVRRIVRREVDCQLRDFQRIGDPLAWIVVSEDALNRLALLFAWTRPNIGVSVGLDSGYSREIPRSTSSALRIRARWLTAALQVETVEVVGHPLRAPTDEVMITDEPRLSSGKLFES